MQLDEALRELEAAGTAQNRKVYARHGIGERMFGVGFGAVRALAKRIGTDATLARALWETGNHDARVLATMVADPAALAAAQLDGWARDLDNYVVTDAFADLVARTPHAVACAEKWMDLPGEWLGRAGWRLVALLAMASPDVPDAWFEARLATIEHEIHARMNRVRDAMNGALIAIGVRNASLTPRALAAARRIGTVEVDHGETGCKTPAAAEYIHHTLEHHAAKETKGKVAATPPAKPTTKARRRS